jgi:hypothetical protein
MASDAQLSGSSDCSIVRGRANRHRGSRLDRFAGSRSAYVEKKDDPRLSKRLKQTGAGAGRRSPKTGQSNYFVGYKKHTLSGFVTGDDGVCPIALYSLVRSAAKADVEMLKPLLNYARHQFANQIPMHFVVGDKAYISADRARFLREKWSVALIVKPRSDMSAPSCADTDGCPLCPMGRRLEWEDYDPTDGVLLYHAQEADCVRCPMSPMCNRRFEFQASDHETFWGMVPTHSRLSRQLLRHFRPRVEPGFNASKNLCGLSKFFINSCNLAQQLCTMSDVVECLKKLAAKRSEGLPRIAKTLRYDKTQPDLWD